MIRGQAILLTLVLAGCSSPNFGTPPVPAVMPDGGRGFGMSGYSTYTSSEDVAKQDVQSQFDTACGGKAEIVQWKAWRADSVIGIPHIHYDAVARCL